jgi:hypothetical protein
VRQLLVGRPDLFYDIDHVLNTEAEIVRVYLASDQLLAVSDEPLLAQSPLRQRSDRRRTHPDTNEGKELAALQATMARTKVGG